MLFSVCSCLNLLRSTETGGGELQMGDIRIIIMVSQVTPAAKNLPANAGDLRGTGSIPGSGRSLEKEMATRLENSIDRGAWWQSMGWQRVGHD